MSDTAVSTDHHYTATGLPTWKVGFWTFMGSECLFFASLISTYMVYKGASTTGPLAPSFSPSRSRYLRSGQSSSWSIRASG